MSDAAGGVGGVFWGTDAVVRIVDLINGAQKHLILVSPYVRFDDYRAVKRALRDALNRKVEVKLVVRSKDASNKNDIAASYAVSELRQLGLKLLEVEDLHAKAYWSEKAAIVTSLNLLQSSFSNSIELGIWLEAGTAQYRQVYEFLNTTIKRDAREVSRAPVVERPQAKLKTKAGRRSHKSAVALEDDEGFCIRCEEDIDLDTEKPFCRSCFRQWRDEDASNPRTQESYCHDCGDETKTSFVKPLCKSCYDLQAA